MRQAKQREEGGQDGEKQDEQGATRWKEDGEEQDEQREEGGQDGEKQDVQGATRSLKCALRKCPAPEESKVTQGLSEVSIWMSRLLDFPR